MTTIVLICERKGKGWSIVGKFETPGLKNIVNCVPFEELKAGSLREYMKKYIDEDVYAFRSFVQDLEAPGRWYQVIWHCPNKQRASFVTQWSKNRQTLVGRYLDSLLLYQLTESEYIAIKKQHIDA